MDHRFVVEFHHGVRLESQEGHQDGLHHTLSKLGFMADLSGDEIYELHAGY